jgi:hypothetical protein
MGSGFRCAQPGPVDGLDSFNARFRQLILLEVEACVEQDATHKILWWVVQDKPQTLQSPYSQFAGGIEQVVIRRA